MKKAVIGCVIICLSIGLSQAQRTPPLNSNKSGIGPTRVWRCYPLRYDSKIGMSYGIQNNSFGIKIHEWRLGIPLRLMIEMEWRKGSQKNSYLNLDFTKNIASLGKFSVTSNLGYKRVSSGDRNVNNQLYAGLSLFKNFYGITLAYAREHYQLSDNFSLYDDGILIRCYHEFFDQFEVQLSGIYWFDQFQYSIQLKENLFQSNFTVGVGYEKIGVWNEISVSVMYQYF